MFLRSSILRLNRGTAAGGWLSRSVARNVAAMSTETAASGNVPDRQVIKRFYKEVTVVKEDDGDQFQIRLDHRTLRTPAKKTIVRVPHEAMAYGIAREFDAQRTEIQSHTMHLSGLTFTAIDIENNIPRKERIAQMMRFLETDVVCWRSPDNEELLKQQKEHWDPIVNWFAETFKVPVKVTSGKNFLFSQDPQTALRLESFLNESDENFLVGLEFATLTSKSIIGSVALCVDNGPISSCTLSESALLESSHQQARWGTVEQGHEMERVDVTARLAAAALFARTMGKHGTI